MKNRNILFAGLAGLLAVAAGAFLFLKKNNNRSEQKPPQKAPQLRVTNPGDQSEFLSAPSEKTQLG